MKISPKISTLAWKLQYNSSVFFNKNNVNAQNYQKEGLNLLRGKVDKLPEKIAFRPKFIKQSACVKALNNFYIFISKNNFTKPVSEKFDALFHEVGHWLHFQNLPPKRERQNVWSKIDLEKIKKEVSERATQNNEGLEFVAEVFKGLVKGKTYDDYVMNFYKRLNGPKVK